MVFGFIECVAVVAWATLIFWQWTSYTSMKSTKWYTDKKPGWMPPSWVFPLAWTLLYSALTIMMFYFTKETAADSWQLIVGFVLFLVHIALNKEWSVAFWDRKNLNQAFWILLVGMLPTSLVLYVPFVVNQTSELYYVPVIMVTIYNAWLIYAAFLNYHWLK